ncbi:uncharacterized protein LOC105288008 [Ooceraea biroi]|uniref:uncharacterized protein LOC105288008 n=1 Tax=Ooceraea biroi TaxID=2015173 RepID=UPI0005B8F484|nr:uncharacterized protein LOC105288008 [Ooceraea biroi]
MARSKSSTFLPSLQSTKRQTFDGKSKLDDKKIDPVEALARTADKLHIDESTEGNITNKLIEETASEEETVEHVRNLRSMTIPSYDIDGMTTEELQASLRKITENAQQPFVFLTNISEELARDYDLLIKTKESTDINIELTAVAKRIESCKMLLEEAESRVKHRRYRANPDDIWTRLSEIV